MRINVELTMTLSLALALALSMALGGTTHAQVSRDQVEKATREVDRPVREEAERSLIFSEEEVPIKVVEEDTDTSAAGNPGKTSPDGRSCP